MACGGIILLRPCIAGIAVSLILFFGITIQFDGIAIRVAGIIGIACDYKIVEICLSIIRIVNVYNNLRVAGIV